jgi:hypothetical protein
MATRPILVVMCDRCDDEIGREEIPPEGAPKKPSVYMSIFVDENGVSREKVLQHLCARCRKDVTTLDQRIFAGGRTRQTTKEGAPDEPKSGE